MASMALFFVPKSKNSKFLLIFNLIVYNSATRYIGAMADRLCRSLQSFVERFDSA
ncbi:MAG: hypothetical protein ACD_2C00200G0007, partial [uncultured bacterium (gcode 4)]